MIFRFFLLMLIMSANHSFGQITAMPDSAGGKMNNEQIAKWTANIYADALGLDAVQKSKICYAILANRNLYDSLNKRGEHVSTEKLWGYRTALDSAFKDALTERQYLRYTEMGRIQIYQVKFKK
jgi:hypothetical protein